MFRWTLKELEIITLGNPEAIKSFIISILTERKENLNPYAPLYKKIIQVQNWIKKVKFPKTLS